MLWEGNSRHPPPRINTDSSPTVVGGALLQWLAVVVDVAAQHRMHSWKIVIKERRKARRVGSEVKEETKRKGELDLTHVQPGCEEILIHGDQEVDQENNNQKEETLKRRADAIIQIQNLLKKTSETTDTGTCR